MDDPPARGQAGGGRSGHRRDRRRVPGSPADARRAGGRRRRADGCGRARGGRAPYATAHAPGRRSTLREWLRGESRGRGARRAARAAGPRLGLPAPRVRPLRDGRERDHLVPPAVRAQVAAHDKGRYEGLAGTPFLLVDGMCAGIWRRRKAGKRIELTVEPARRLTQAERAGLAEEAERIGRFLGVEPRLTVALASRRSGTASSSRTRGDREPRPRSAARSPSAGAAPGAGPRPLRGGARGSGARSRPDRRARSWLPR